MIKISTFYFTGRNPANFKKVLRYIEDYIRKTGGKCSHINHELISEAEDRLALEDTPKSNRWLIFNSSKGRCKITIDGKSAVIEFNPEEIKVIEIKAGTKYYLQATVKDLYTEVSELLI